MLLQKIISFRYLHYMFNKKNQRSPIKYKIAGTLLCKPYLFCKNSYNCQTSSLLIKLNFRKYLVYFRYILAMIC